MENRLFFDVDFDDFAPSLSFFPALSFFVSWEYSLFLLTFFVRVGFFAVQENYLLAQTRREASLQHAILVRSAGDAVSQTFSTVHFAKSVPCDAVLKYSRFQVGKSLLLFCDLLYQYAFHPKGKGGGGVFPKKSRFSAFFDSVRGRGGKQSFPPPLLTPSPFHPPPPPLS